MSLNFTFSYLDYVLSLNYSNYVDYVYQIELQTKDPMVIARYLSSLP